MAPSADPINPQHGPSFQPFFNGGGPTTMNGINGINGDSHDHAHGPATPANGSKRVDSPGRGRSQSAAESGPVRADKDHRTDDRSEHVHSTRKRGASGPVKKTLSHDNVQRLSAAEMQELTSSPDSLPIAPAPQPLSIEQQDLGSPSLEMRLDFRQHARQLYPDGDATANGVPAESRAGRGYWKFDDSARRPLHAPRTVSTPPTTRIQPADGTPYSSSPRRFSFNPSPRPPPLSLNGDGANGFLAAHMPPPAIQSASPILASQQPDPAPSPARGSRPPSPIPAMIPLPPMSLPTHLQLELAAQRPSPLYIHHSHSNDIPYESSSEKFERLKNVLLLPPYLERVLNFGALACLDAWLYTFTILPVRFIMALAILIRWWGYVVGKETMWLVGYVWYGLGRLWRRGRHDQSRRPSNASEGDRSRSRSRVRELHVGTDTKTPNPRERSLQTRRELHADGASETLKSPVPTRDPGPKTGAFRHRRTKSTPSSLSAFHKADLLQGAVIICSSLALMTLDASRMYHFIRAQSAIKLYVIYNILEVGDRLLSALGQDILECLFSSETLSRNASGRSKVLLPLGMFMLALAYNCLHSIALYYQVITLNVAVNSYSNALLTLLLSNQFVEIKSTVFKRFEKDNLFQLTCADIVERFHLWIMLLIIGMRNVVEVGGLSVPGAGLDSTYDDAGPVPLHPPSILPHSFTVLPSWLMSGEVLSPFLIVVGSEMLVDSIKHAYVTKFNNIKPTFYSRTLDILCKDYYTNAFVTPSLTRRLGLAVIPLSCLFIRASIQTYHMFLSTHIPMPLPQSTQTSLTEESATPSSPAMMAALNRFDSLIRDSLGRATYGYPYGSPLNSRSWYSWTSDDFIAALTMVVVFFIAFLVLLILKLLLGMLLLKYARNRYVKMKHKEQLVARGAAAPESYDALGRRVGGRGEVEVSDDKQRWIHADKTEGLRGGKGPGGKRPAGGGTDDKGKKQEGEYQGVFRYEMVAKRIW